MMMSHVFLNSNWTFSQDHYMNVFEMTIRVLGGLISAYDLTGDTFKSHAIEVASLMSPAFTDTQILPEVNPLRRRARQGYTTLASRGSLQLEYARIAIIANDSRFMNISKTWKSLKYEATHPFSLNGGHDSLHEYVLKLYLLGNKTDAVLYHMYNEMVSSIVSNLVKFNSKGRAFIGTLRQNFMEHLSCFTPGMIALGILQNASMHADRDFRVAAQLTESCYQLYSENKVTGLSPDSFSLRYDKN